MHRITFVTEERMVLN